MIFWFTEILIGGFGDQCSIIIYLLLSIIFFFVYIINIMFIFLSLSLYKYISKQTCILINILLSLFINGYKLLHLINQQFIHPSIYSLMNEWMKEREREKEDPNYSPTLNLSLCYVEWIICFAWLDLSVETSSLSLSVPLLFLLLSLLLLNRLLSNSSIYIFNHRSSYGCH